MTVQGRHVPVRRPPPRAAKKKKAPTKRSSSICLAAAALSQLAGAVLCRAASPRSAPADAATESNLNPRAGDRKRSKSAAQTREAFRLSLLPRHPLALAPLCHINPLVRSPFPRRGLRHRWVRFVCDFEEFFGGF